jgi:hypothetical protein
MNWFFKQRIAQLIGRVCLGLILLFCTWDAWAHMTPLSRTVNDLRAIDGALEQYRLEKYRLPTQGEGLSLVAEYLHGQTIPRDAWDHEFIYRNPGVHDTNNVYDLYSLGPDGISKSGGNDPDDINLWHPPSPRNSFSLPYWAWQVGLIVLLGVGWIVAGLVWRRISLGRR